MAGTAETREESHPSRIHEIWLIGLAELYAKTGTVDFWKYYGELQQLKRRPLEILWLEATISMAVIGHIRPGRVTGYLNKLRSRREKQGHMAEFERFNALLRTYLNPDSWEADDKSFRSPPPPGEQSSSDVLPLRNYRKKERISPDDTEKMLEINDSAKWQRTDPLLNFPSCDADRASGSFAREAKR